MAVAARRTAVKRRIQTGNRAFGAGGLGPRRPFAAGTGALGKAGGDSEGVGLGETGFDPVGDAAVLPDQRVGSHAQGLRLIVAADLDDDQVRLARYPPTGVAVYRDFLHRRPLLHPFEDEAGDEVATELGDEHA